MDVISTIAAVSSSMFMLLGACVVINEEGYSVRVSQALGFVWRGDRQPTQRFG